MVKLVLARQLLRDAAALYDDPSTGLANAANRAWQWGFASGAEWMRLALGQIRGIASTGSAQKFNVLGTIKYGLASAGAFLCVAMAFLNEQPLLVLLVVPVFYAVEAQMVFLFPLALDDTPALFVEARAMTVRAGGTLAVMRIVLPLAAVMLFGGFFKQGFVRSWCLGCLAVCLWYERVRTQAVDAVREAKTA